MGRSDRELLLPTSNRELLASEPALETLDERRPKKDFFFRSVIVGV